jgi:hypothetical protein
MADIPVSIVRNRPIISKKCSVTFSILIPPNPSMGMVSDCACMGAIRFELGATVLTMRGILSKTGMSGCYDFVTTCCITLA